MSCYRIRCYDYGLWSLKDLQLQALVTTSQDEAWVHRSPHHFLPARRYRICESSGGPESPKPKPTKQQGHNNSSAASSTSLKLRSLQSSHLHRCQVNQRTPRRMPNSTGCFPGRAPLSLQAADMRNLEPPHFCEPALGGCMQTLKHILWISPSSCASQIALSGCETVCSGL